MAENDRWGGVASEVAWAWVIHLVRRAVGDAFLRNVQVWGLVSRTS